MGYNHTWQAIVTAYISWFIKLKMKICATNINYNIANVDFVTIG